MMPILVFAYCYGRIFYTIRRQNKVISGHTGRTQVTTTGASSRDATQQQVTSTNLSHTELNVINILQGIIQKGLLSRLMIYTQLLCNLD